MILLLAYHFGVVILRVHFLHQLEKCIKEFDIVLKNKNFYWVSLLEMVRDTKSVICAKVVRFYPSLICNWRTNKLQIFWYWENQNMSLLIICCDFFMCVYFGELLQHYVNIFWIPSIIAEAKNFHVKFKSYNSLTKVD